MEPIWRAVLIFVGSFLFITGIGKMIWEMYSWGVLAQTGERPPLVGNNPRVYFRLYILVAAIGATIVALAIFL